MEQSNNLETVTNEALQECAAKWSKIAQSLKGKQAKRHIALLAMLAIYGPQTTWNLAKLYLEKFEKHRISGKKPEAFFYCRMKENSTIYKRLKFLESKGYVHREGSVYYPTVKAWFLLFVVNPRFASILPLERFNQAIQTLELEPENEQFMDAFDKMNEPQLSNIIEAVKNAFGNPVTAKGASETLRHFIWSLKINMDEISSKQLMNILVSQLRKMAKEARNSKPITINIPEP